MRAAASTLKPMETTMNRIKRTSVLTFALALAVAFAKMKLRPYGFSAGG